MMSRFGAPLGLVALFSAAPGAAQIPVVPRVKIALYFEESPRRVFIDSTKSQMNFVLTRRAARTSVPRSDVVVPVVIEYSAANQSDLLVNLNASGGGPIYFTVPSPRIRSCSTLNVQHVAAEQETSTASLRSAIEARMLLRLPRGNPNSCHHTGLRTQVERALAARESELLRQEYFFRPIFKRHAG